LKLNDSSKRAVQIGLLAVLACAIVVVAYRHYQHSRYLAEVAAGHGLMDADKLEEALEHFRRAVEYEPNEPRAHDRLGVCLFALSQRREGIAELNRAIAMDPTLASAHLNLAVAYTENGEEQLATKEARLALLYGLPDSEEAAKAKEILASPSP
jgi:tetratricopeptide (TPR) repeat protein